MILVICDKNGNQIWCILSWRIVHLQWIGLVCQTVLKCAVRKWRLACSEVVSYEAIRIVNRTHLPTHKPNPANLWQQYQPASTACHRCVYCPVFIGHNLINYLCLLQKSSTFEIGRICCLGSSEPFYLGVAAAVRSSKKRACSTCIYNSSRAHRVRSGCTLEIGDDVLSGVQCAW